MKRIDYLASFTALFLVMGCGKAPSGLEELEGLLPGEVLHYDEDEGVRVRVRVAAPTGTTRVIIGTFLPDEAGYHLYSKDLPREGIDGAGRPTLIEVRGEAKELGIEVGELVVDKAEKVLETEFGDFPVYPDGAVELRLPLGFGSVEAIPDKLEIALTFMSCDDLYCKNPAEGMPVTVSLR